MENLETQEKVINLGKKLISNFQEDEPDQITAWMISYLSEQILSAENGDEKAKKECFDTIIQLWENHSVFPDNSRPFKNFEPIFIALDSLSPESSIPRYFSRYYDEQEVIDNGLQEEITKSIELAKQLDSIAKILITSLFEQAVELANDEDTQDWLQKISGVTKSNELKFVTRFTDETEQDGVKQRIEDLNKRIAQLDAFEKISRVFREGLQEELNSLATDNCSGM